jgi:hypothetical protein
MLSIDVNWLNIIVFSSPFERALMSSRISRILETLADMGGRDDAPLTDLRRALTARAEQSEQWTSSSSEELSLERVGQLCCK